MKFGFEAPIGGPDATPERLTRLVRHGEEMGFEIIGAGDHIVTFSDIYFEPKPVKRPIRPPG
ncbi:MAG: hypothetical protein O3A47_03440 [Chloroflexi bacterium]|nr:hypothetical protein [Chloroflexota bacterium]